MPQLLDLVERAVRGDRQLGGQLFNAMRELAGHPAAPVEQRELAGVLVRVLIGEKSPNLDALPAGVASAVRGMLGRLKVQG